MCNPAVIPIITAVIGAGAAYQQGQTAKKVARNNQIMAEYAAQDAERRGEEAAIEAQRRGAQIKGAQRARMAAAGLDLNVGTSSELQSQTDFFSQVDATTARNNARRAAWNARATGNAAMAQGNAEAYQSNLQAFGTLLGGASQVAGKWNQYKKPPVG